MQETKIISDNSFVKAFQETFSSRMKDNFNKTFSNNSLEEKYFMEKEKKKKKLNIQSHDIKFMHNLPMLIHFIGISNDIRTRIIYDKKTEENLKTFSVYEKTGWKIIPRATEKHATHFAPITTGIKNFVTFLTNVALAKQHNITLSMKSDILRFVIMHEFGGMYFDTDFNAIRNMDHIIRNGIKNNGLIVAQEDNKKRSMYLAGGFFAAYPGNSCIKNAKNYVVAAIRGEEMSNIR